MKLSEILPEKIRDLSSEQITRIVFGGWTDSGLSADAAILLGGNPIVLPDRARAAAELYEAGRISYIVPTGGVEWDTELGRMSEAEYMAVCLKQLGIPEGAVLLENDARTTVENMLFSTILLNRRLKIRNLHRLCIVTSPSHLRRSMEYAALYLPRNLEVFGYTDPQMPDGAGRWTEDPFYANRVLREADLLAKDVRSGWFEEIEF